MNPELLKLPWATLLTLASGYAGYYVANVGARDHLKAIDVTFSTLVYGFFAIFAYNLFRLFIYDDILTASAVAFFVAIISGGVWRRWCRARFVALLRRSHVSYSDDLPSAWIALFHEGTRSRQLSVKLKDGSWLKCENLDLFSDYPDGPCVFGGSGDLLMYVTHFQGKDDDTFEECPQTIDAEWGSEITYIPAGEIARLDVRRIAKPKKKKS